jgi:hypothetical protein
MTVAKRKVSVSLAEDLVEEPQSGHRSPNRILVEFLDRLDQEHGPVDESLVGKYVGLLS